MKFVLTCTFLVFSFNVFSQSILESRLDGSEKGKKVAEFLKELEEKYPLKCFYIEDWFQNIYFEKSYKGVTLSTALQDALNGIEINFIWMHDYALVFVKDPTRAIQRKEIIDNAILGKKKIQRLVVGHHPDASNSRDMAIIKGKVMTGEAMEPLIGATVRLTDSSTGNVTREDGSFELKAPLGAQIVRVNYLNFEEVILDLDVLGSGEVNVFLDEKPTLLDEVVVQDKAIQENTTTRIGIAQINIRELKRSPALLGEPDVVRQIQTLPGVTTAGEAASGFNVRGGSVDQNLVLYDGTPVFNSSHVFGFFSTFNTEAIRDVNFYKGGIPAEYGGRVSSVLDIRSKEGDYDKWKAAGGISLIFCNLMIGGPIKKGKTSIAVSGRSSYSDWITNNIRTNYVDLKKSSISFYDATIKLSHRVSDKTKITLSGYLSHDFFRLKGDSSYQWTNRLISFRLDHQFNRRFTSDYLISVGYYGYKVEAQNNFNGFTLAYENLYPSLKANFQYQKGIHYFNFGIHSTYYRFNPGTLWPYSPQSTIQNVTMDRQNSLETALYIGDGITLKERIFIESGIRFSSFSAIGPASNNLYSQGVSRDVLTVIDTIRHGSGEFYRTYFGLEPRASIRYSLSPTISIKAGYNRIYQYLHLVSNTTAVTPVDIWQPSGYYFKPQYADQISLGMYKDSKNKKYSASLEGYYKTIQNLLDFKDGAQLILNKHIETDLVQGKGRAYGLEVSLSKTTGRITGSVNYTYSRSLRTISGLSSSESINNGKEYASNFDQPNVINSNLKIALTRRIFFTGNFTFRTGRPVTLPTRAFSVDHFSVASFSDRNQFRIPNYHRLDLALVFEGNLKRKKIWDGTFAISVYNVYARKNPYSVFYKENGNGILVPYILSIVGTAFPSISYSFKIN